MEPREKAAQLPESPGVYLFKDAGETVLYVGKARNLRGRVRSYFIESRWIDAKTGSLAREIADLETIVVGNEREALALEHNLIKKYRPKFNVLLRDDKTYPYIKVTTGEPWPRALFTRRVEDRAGVTASKTDGALFRAVFSSRFGAAYSALHSQALYGSIVRGGFDAQPSAALLAVLHQALPRPLRLRAHQR